MLSAWLDGEPILLHDSRWDDQAAALREAARVVALEHPLAESQQRPDVYLELNDGTRYALEYQRSAISLVEWQERHIAYQRQGIHGSPGWRLCCGARRRWYPHRSALTSPALCQAG